jgi:hypothetical protein
MRPIRCPGPSCHPRHHRHPRDARGAILASISIRGSIRGRALGWSLVLALALGAPFGAGRAAAQEADDLDTQGIPDETINTGVRTQTGDYGGVTPGESTSRKPRRPNRVTWVGFQVKDDGTSTLFVQLTSEVPFTQEVAGGKLIVRLEGARYSNRNARRRLDTRFFETALQQVTSRAVSKRRARGDQPARPAGVELTISFKNPEDAREARAELRQEQDGYHYLYLSFGAAGVRTSGQQ